MLRRRAPWKGGDQQDPSLFLSLPATELSLEQPTASHLIQAWVYLGSEPWLAKTEVLHLCRR